MRKVNYQPSGGVNKNPAASRLVGKVATVKTEGTEKKSWFKPQVRVAQRDERREGTARTGVGRSPKVGLWMPSERETPKLIFGKEKATGKRVEANQKKQESSASTSQTLNWWLNYGQYLQLLVLAGFFYLLVGLLMRNVPPSRIAHWLLPNTYLAWQLLLLGGNFFFFTFLWQSRLLGVLSAGLILSWFFFRFQQIVMTWPVILLAVGPWLIAIGIVWWKRYNKARYVKNF